VIANQFGEAFGTQRSALFALGVSLFILTLLVNVLARAVVSRSGHEVVTGAVR
jgi:ABC-type phosphate transport system permease subunit